MPTYEYKCPRCGTRFERVQKITARPGAPCPKCGAKAERLISGGHGLLFKGSGFYETDYKRPSDKARHEKAKSDGAARRQKEGGEKAPAPPKPDSSKSDSKAD
jgi:putative FmdB family regulatory protein